MDKKVKIDGTHNRYLIKKVNHEKLPEKKKNIFDKTYSHEYQKKIINELYSNSNDNDINNNNNDDIDNDIDNDIDKDIDKDINKVKKEILKKQSSYKQQDKKKGVYDESNFIKCNEIYEMLVKNVLKCNYCCCNINIIYDNYRDDFQWSLDRINNDIGHITSNVCISCLKCNLQRRNKDYSKFKESKEIKFIKKID